MIATVAKLKERLSITDVLKDALLTQIIGAVGARFDDETARTLAHTVGATEEFRVDGESAGNERDAARLMANRNPRSKRNPISEIRTLGFYRS